MLKRSVEVVLKKNNKTDHGVNFFYDQKKISQSSRVNLNVSNQTIETVLKSLSIQTGICISIGIRILLT